MKAAMAAAWLFGLVFGQAGIAFAAEKPILIVAAENVYGDIARQVGGERVSVVSIMSNPDQDPHLFETTPGIVRQIAAAQIVILNGANYDPWMDKLLTAAPRDERPGGERGRDRERRVAEGLVLTELVGRRRDLGHGLEREEAGDHGDDRAQRSEIERDAREGREPRRAHERPGEHGECCDGQERERKVDDEGMSVLHESALRETEAAV